MLRVRLTLENKFCTRKLQSCQPRVTVTSCFVYTVIRDVGSMDHFCIDYYTSDTSIRISSSGVYKLIFYLTIVKKHDVTVTLGWQDNSIFLSFVLDAQRN